jgi:hypothetical protein
MIVTWDEPQATVELHTYALVVVMSILTMDVCRNMKEGDHGCFSDPKRPDLAGILQQRRTGRANSERDVHRSDLG